MAARIHKRAPLKASPLATPVALKINSFTGTFSAFFLSHPPAQVNPVIQPWLKLLTYGDLADTAVVAARCCGRQVVTRTAHILIC